MNLPQLKAPSTFFSLIVCCFPGMLISACSRQCVLKLKDYSDKKASTPVRSRSMINSHHNDENPNPSSALMAPLVSNSSNDNILSNDPSMETSTDRSLLGRLLNCKPCKQVTDAQKEKKVCLNRKNSFLFKSMEISPRMLLNEIGKIVKLISIGNIKQKSTTLKHKKLIKLKKNWII